jgi:hypothetical protein
MIEISTETEVRINDEARRQGVSVDALLERLISECGGPHRGRRRRPQTATVASGSDGSSSPARNLRRCPLIRVSSTRTFWPMPST